MTPTRIFLTVLTCFFTSVSPHNTFAQSASDPQAILQAAKDDLTARNAAIGPDLRFAFTGKVLVSGDEPLTIEYTFDPAKPLAEQWGLVHPSEEENAKARADIIKDHEKQLRKAAKKEGEPEKGPDQQLILRSFKRDGEMAKDETLFLREEGDELIFSFDPGAGSISFSGDGDSEDKGKKKKKNQKNQKVDYLAGEIGISKSAKQILWMHVYATKSFKPVVVAKVKNFDMMVHFASAWDGGPLVTVRQEVTVSGSAMFRKFNQQSTTTNSGFKKR